MNLDLIHDVLPSALRPSGVAGREIGAGDFQVERGLALGVVLGLDHLSGFGLVGGFKAGAFAGGFVHAVEPASAMAAVDETVSVIHVFHATEKVMKPNPQP